MEWNPIEKSKPGKDEPVLCAGSHGGYFVGYWRDDNMFYVPNYRGGYRNAAAWARFDHYDMANKDGR